MSRSVFGVKKVKRLRFRFPDLQVIGAWSRGNTNHRVDLLLQDGTIAYLEPDGVTVERSHDQWAAGPQTRAVANAILQEMEPTKH